MMSEALRLDEVTAETFAPFVGSEFKVAFEESGEAVTSLALAESVPSRLSGIGLRQPFSLFFEGRPEAALDQGTYWLSHPVLGELFLFIVPISADSQARRYQAVFN